MNKKIITACMLAVLICPKFGASEVKQDVQIDSDEMDLTYTSVVPTDLSLDQLVARDYIKMYYPNGKEVPFDSSGDQYTFMSYLHDVTVIENTESYRINFKFSTSLSGTDQKTEDGSFVMGKEEEDITDLDTLTPSIDTNVPEASTGEKLDRTIDTGEMKLEYTSQLDEYTSMQSLVANGYMKMYYPNGKEVPFDSSGDQYTFMSYFSNVEIREFSTSYQVIFEFSTSLSGTDTQTEIGSFIVNK